MATSLRDRVLKMCVGETIVIPIADYSYTTIKSYASDLGFIYKRKYTSKRNREDRTYTITRLS